MQKTLTASYFLFLGSIIGIEFAAGAFVAPVIFFPAAYIGEGVLSHFQSGLLMTQIFLRLNIMLMIFSIFAWGYEFYMFYLGQRDKYTIILLGLICTCIYLFVFYYTPQILEAQKMGESMLKNADFVKTHKQSESVMKALIMLQTMLLFRRVWLILDLKKP